MLSPSTAALITRMSDPRDVTRLVRRPRRRLLDVLRAA